MFRKLPPGLRTKLKTILQTDGHGQSTFDGLSARKDASGKKRLDRALAEIVERLDCPPADRIRGKVCIDFGAGYVPTDGVALWLLGAKLVHGIDYNSIAKPAEMARAVRAADIRRVEEQLRGLQIDDSWRQRLAQLQHWARQKSRDFPPGYNYLAPLDVITYPERLPKFDILVSNSVLEHIPPSRLGPVLDALKSRENLGAAQIHRVDLRDHRDFENNPYGFLDPSIEFDAEVHADSRGNAMTLNDWTTLLADHPEWGLGIGTYTAGRPHLMPAETSTSADNVVADCVILRSNAYPSPPSVIEH